jgi:hypothetical protein
MFLPLFVFFSIDECFTLCYQEKTEKGWKGMTTKENRWKVKNLTLKIGGERIATDLVQIVSPFTSSHPSSPATVQSLEQGESFFFSSFSPSHPV